MTTFEFIQMKEVIARQGGGLEWQAQPVCGAGVHSVFLPNFHRARPDAKDYYIDMRPGDIDRQNRLREWKLATESGFFCFS